MPRLEPEVALRLDLDRLLWRYLGQRNEPATHARFAAEASALVGKHLDVAGPVPVLAYVRKEEPGRLHLAVGEVEVARVRQQIATFPYRFLHPR
jgi:hypothetical protein